MDSLLIGTANESKLPYLISYFDGSGIDCISPAALGLQSFEAQENARTAQDNAVQKALSWYRAAHMPVLALDAGLVFLDLPDDHPDQPGVHVRRAAGHVMDDDELLAYFMDVARRHGGRLRAAWQDSYCLMKDATNYYSYTFDRDMLLPNAFYLMDTPCEKRVPGWPLNSISVDIFTGKYWLDMTEADRHSASEALNGQKQRTREALTVWLKTTALNILQK